MAANSKIEWTEASWNPTTGCTKVSPGCKYCYAEPQAIRLFGMGKRKYRNKFDLTLHEFELETPLHWKKPRRIFVDSMSDLFHEKIPLKFIKKVFDIMNKTEEHTYQVLTKRPDMLEKYYKELNWTKNIWIGVSIENQEYVYRADSLRKVPAAVRFLSIEPLIDEIKKINLKGIDWVIVGGESRNNRRPMNPDWARTIRDKCLEKSIPFFFKQWGGYNKKKNGRELDGRTWDEMPVPVLRK